MTTTISQDDIEQFCSEHDVDFYQMGHPGDWEDTRVFRASSHTFPVRGITIELAKVREWLENPPFVTEGI